MIGQAEINNRWDQHQTTPGTSKQHEAIREGAKLLAAIIDQNVPDSRAKSLSLTNLQQASMWANFGISEQAPLVEKPPVKVDVPATAVPRPPRQ